MNRILKPFLKKISKEEETIAAISTPFGESGIGIVRLSGQLSETIAKRIFKPKKDLPFLITHQFHYGEIIDPQNGMTVDEVLLVLMRAPKTYTREDIVEIHCHGGYFVLQKVLELTLREGARLAEPGEFTKRAFLNGRIDLTQAEAVIDLIKAKTIKGLEIANQQLRGMIFKEINSIKERLIEHLILMEAHIDFPEEDIDPIHLGEIEDDFKKIIQKLDQWISSFEEGRVFREGISCAIVGKTNVGKSSLLNVLLKEDRAIVTPIPGTTRDVIEEVLNIHGIPVRLIDTAGLRKANDFLELEGQRRARQRLKDADLILLMIDGSRPLDQDDKDIFQEVKEKRKIIIINKIDLPKKTDLNKLKRELLEEEEEIVQISALKNEGIEVLKRSIYNSIIHKDIKINSENLILSNIRHKNLLSMVKENLSDGLKGLRDGIPLEFIVFDIRSSLDCLGELVGETTPEEILNRIFEQFCIGK